MKYTAHTKEAIPVLRAFTTLPEPAWDDSVTHNLGIKEIRISPQHKSHWQDGQEVDENEFEVHCFMDGNKVFPKQKEESQEQLWNQFWKDIMDDNVSTDDMQSKYIIKRK
jgi:hypothetical protein